MSKKGLLTGNFLMDVVLWIAFLIVAGLAVWVLINRLAG